MLKIFYVCLDFKCCCRYFLICAFSLREKFSALIFLCLHPPARQRDPDNQIRITWRLEAISQISSLCGFSRYVEGGHRMLGRKNWWNCYQVAALLQVYKRIPMHFIAHV